MNKILSSTKELLGIPDAATEFDSQLVLQINSVLTTLHEIGFSEDVYQTTLTDGDLEEYIPDDEAIRAKVQMYIFTKVRLVFDPPTSSFVLTALQATAAEYEWRLTDYCPPNV